MEIKQIRLDQMATFCYIIGDKKSKTCALIDPAFDTTRILATADKEGYRITHLINTHHHTDHTAGNAAIISATRAQLLIHRLDADRLTKFTNRAFSLVMGGRGSPPADRQLEDGDEIEIGETRLKVIHTPGHTPGSICLYSENNLFTGDTLFVGGVGRTDLPGGSTQLLKQSILEKLYCLPDDCTVWPGHDYGHSPQSTIEHEKRTNPFVRGL